jgi:carboxypeptidase T
MPYLNIDEVETALEVATSAPYNAFTQLITLPNLTWEGRRCHAIKIANGSNLGRPGVYFLGGVHAREWGSSDILINFIEQLEQSYLSNKGLTFGNKSFSASDIQTVVNTLDIIVFPQANPDGRNYSMNSDAMWRKNRRILQPNSNSGGNPTGSCVGVDINRNYDFLWDFHTYFSPSSPVQDSTDPCDYQLYDGPTAFSEPETKNSKWIFDTFPNIDFFIDLHSYSEDILYSWGDDDDQTNNPSMNFQNQTFNGLRGIAGDSAYKEYIPSSDLSVAIDLANIFRDGIQLVRGTTYTVKPSMNLYPTAGTSDEYAYSRHFVDSTKQKVIAYTLEWGTEFQPPYAEMQNIIEEITSGLLAFCLWTCNNLKFQISRLADRLESLQSQVKLLQQTRSLGRRSKTVSVRARRSSNISAKTKKKAATRKGTGKKK